MAYKANRDTYAFAFAPDAFGNSESKVRMQVMAGQEFPPGAFPEEEDAVENFEPEQYAGPSYPPESITLDRRLREDHTKDAERASKPRRTPNVGAAKE